MKSVPSIIRQTPGRFIGIIVSVLPIVVCAYVLWHRFALGQVRYFDADELAYLHWAHNVYIGEIPYRNFLLYATPGYLFLLAPLYAFVHGVSILTVGRVVAWLVFVGLGLSLGFLHTGLRGKGLLSWVLPLLFLSFLPLPADKFLEIRPDTLAMLFVVLGMGFEVRAFSAGNNRLWFWSGILYGISVFVLQKSIPFVIVSCAVTLVWAASGKNRLPALLRFAAAGGLVIFMMFVAAIISNPSLAGLMSVWYQLAVLPSEVNKLGAVFYVGPMQFFYPNGLFYGEYGWSIGLLANHAIWMTGLITGSIRTVTPYIANGKKGIWAEWLVGISMLVSAYMFFYGYPMRNAQYLIPTAVFVALYAADAVLVIKQFLPTSVFGVGFTALVIGMLFVDARMTGPKFLLTDADNVAALSYALQTIPRNAYVLDLDGSTIYYRDPYAVSAVPFGQWEPFMSRPLPSLPEALEATHTRYVYQGKLGRLGTLSSRDQAYIASHFTPTYNGELYVR